MSDAYYQERARRRMRIIVILVAVATVALLLVLVFRSLFYDACTRSFDRSPRSIALTFAAAVGRGDLPVTQECWQHHAYYDLEAGCSEICLSRVLGTQYTILDVTAGEPYTTPGGRENLKAIVTVECTENGDMHSGEILLDSVGTNVPWKHWAIIRSTFGGTVADPWCQ